MAYVDLLRSLPKSKRNVQQRSVARTPQLLEESRKFGELYFDGTREYGYGGYKYDGRWIPVARDIVAHFDLKPGMRVLDVGCAKGFLVGDLMRVCPGLEVFGLDISEYALRLCEPSLVGRLHRGACEDLPFPDHSFDAALSINTIHNLERTGVVQSLRELTRVTAGQRIFVQVDSYRTETERRLFEEWVLTAKFHDTPGGWAKVFEEAEYRGDWAWTILTE